MTKNTWEKEKLPFAPYDTVTDHFTKGELDWLSSTLAEARKEVIREMIQLAQNMQKHNKPFKKDWEFIEMFVKGFLRKDTL